MKLQPLDPWAGQDAYFNRTAANVIFKSMMDMDTDTSLMFGVALTGEMISYDLTAHAEEVNKAAEEVIEKRANALSSYWAKRAVAKAQRGEDNGDEIAALVEVTKAFNFTPAQRKRHAAQASRLPNGEFAPKGQGGIRQAHPSFKNADRLDAMAQKANAAQAARSPIQPTRLEARNQRSEDNDALDASSARAGVNAASDRRRDRQAARDKKHQVREPGGFVPDALMAAGASASTAANAGALGHGLTDANRAKSFNQARVQSAKNPNEAFSSTNRAFNRLAAGSQSLQDATQGIAPDKLAHALNVANHVGKFGPEAQKVIGPAADRMAYRYRGTEKQLDPHLVAALELIRNTPSLSPQERRQAVLSGRATADGWSPGLFLNGLRNRLPDPELNELQRKSGVIPPSEGVMFDDKGHVTSQSIGYADDWYLPFNLKNLKSLRGGSYVRTRTYGGPTPEDIYTGLMSGARTMSVVSHNGVYTVNFDDTLRGGRRFNDKARRMVDRYEHLLDAVRSGQVTRGRIPPDRMNELRSKAADLAGSDESSEYKSTLNDLKAKEIKKPELSQPAKNRIAADWLDGVAAAAPTPDGRTMSGAEFVLDLKSRQAKGLLQQWRQAAGAPLPPEAKEGATEVVNAQFNAVDPNTEAGVTAVANILGKQRGLQSAIDAGARDNRSHNRAMVLNGQGYRDALQALHEQFPYYIEPPVFHPWSEAVADSDRDPEGGGLDTGYVKPKHNRPAEAQAGFFDPAVNGFGKVPADRTRFQNFAVHGGQIPTIGDKKNAAPAEAAAVPDSQGGRTPQADPEAQLKAHHAVLDDILAQTHFKPGARMEAPNDESYALNGIDGNGNQVNPPIRQAIGMPEFNIDAYKNIFGQSPEKVHAMLQDPATRQKTLDDMNEIRTGGKDRFGPKLALNADVGATADNGGRVAVESSKKPARQLLQELDRPHDFPGRAFDPNQAADAKTIKANFDNESDIKALGLPRDIDDPDMEGSLKDAADRLKREATQLDDISGHGSADKTREDRLQANTLALAKATQLYSKYTKAMKDNPGGEKEAEKGETPGRDTMVVLPSGAMSGKLGEEINDLLARFTGHDKDDDVKSANKSIGQGAGVVDADDEPKKKS